MKKNIIINLCLVLLGILIIIFIDNDSFLYKKNIMKITKVEESVTNEVAGNIESISEKYYEQKITGIVLNGKYKGQKVNAINERSTSLVYDENYKVNDKVFISIDNSEKKLVSIINYKRDVYVASIFVIFVLALYFIGKKQGMFAILALIINILIYCYTVILYTSKGINLITISAISTVIFTIISLLLAIGFNKKSFVTIISTLVTILITILIAVLVMYLTKEKGLRIEQISFLITPYKEAFISELLLGGLGAIMDIAITIASTVNELIEKNSKIENKKLFLSCREIGKDTMGTMLNVLLFTYICSSIPKFILYYRNGFSITEIMHNYLSIDIVRSLVAGIGIVLCIPITSLIAIKILKGKEV